MGPRQELKAKRGKVKIGKVKASKEEYSCRTKIKKRELDPKKEERRGMA